MYVLNIKDYGHKVVLVIYTCYRSAIFSIHYAVSQLPSHVMSRGKEKGKVKMSHQYYILKNNTFALFYRRVVDTREGSECGSIKRDNNPYNSKIKGIYIVFFSNLSKAQFRRLANVPHALWCYPCHLLKFTTMK